LQWVHCQNDECKYFDARYAAKMKHERESESFLDSLDNLILLRGEVLDLGDL